MPQILVGGDNQDAYLICDALETMSASRGQTVVFCATPHEVLSTVGRGGALVVVLNFEKAGLTNFELACRIRESGEGHSVSLLLPEIDALGDVAGTLGKQVGIFSFPVKPGAVAALACKLMDAAPRKASPPAGLPAPAGPTATKPPAPAAASPRQPQVARPDSAVPVPAPARSATPPPEEPPSRTRRVRHRTWREVHSPRREPMIDETSRGPDAGDDASESGVRRLTLPAVKPRFRKLAIALGLLALAAFAFYGLRALRADPDEGVVVPAGDTVSLMCVACNAREERAVTNIHELRCRQCGDMLGFAFHCDDCKKDFAFDPPEKVKTLAGLKAKPECSHCKSWNTKALQPGEAAAVPKAGSAPAAAVPKAGKAATTAPKAGKAATAAPKADGTPTKTPAKPVKSAKPAAAVDDE
jgi:hypothetical protein